MRANPASARGFDCVALVSGWAGEAEMDVASAFPVEALKVKLSSLERSVMPLYECAAHTAGMNLLLIMAALTLLIMLGAFVALTRDDRALLREQEDLPLDLQPLRPRNRRVADPEHYPQAAD